MTTRSSSDFGQQLLNYLDSLYSLAMVFTRKKESAEDLVQQTCLKALENSQRFQTNTNLKAWLFTILRNLWLNNNTRSHSYVALEDDFLTATDQNHEFDREWKRKEIQMVILSLPLLQREILVLRDIEELSYQEIAFVLSCPIGTVMSRIKRARSLLRENLIGSLKRKNAEL